jgi:alkanesulfonate monooxygenase SsuD/methylene tetrahydromethanopterin reductase-like flavin-dependent oxidoreductase (luciferase family)
MRDRVLAAARGAGRSPEDITCAYNIEVRIGEDVEEEEHVVSGRPGEVAARLNDFRKMGFSAMNFMLSGSDTTEQAERLALEVIPELRAMA